MDRENIRSFLGRLQRYSLLGWIRYIDLRIRGKTVIVEGQCKMCGRCCRRVSLEAGGRWLRKEEDFKRVVKKNPDYQRFVLVDTDNQGFLLFSCSWYEKTAGVCADHQNRLSVCRSFPDTDLYFTGGEIPSGCGYRFNIVVPFSAILQQKMNGNDGE